MTPFKQDVKATYIGPIHPAFEHDTEYDLKIVTYGSASPALEVTAEDGKKSINYPSKKKFLEQWLPGEGWNVGTVVKMPVGHRKPARKRSEEITVAEAGAVISTELISAINRFNAKSVQTYPEEFNRPVFELKLQEQVYNEETQEAKGLFGAGVLILELKMFGQKRIVYQEGVSFSREKDLQNHGGYAPKLYIAFMDAIVESAMLYIIALNPDDPANIQALKEEPNATTADTPTTDS